MSHRTIGRIVGALFFAAFVCYGVGSALVDRPLGPALMLLNSAVVATIGVLVFRVFRRPHPRTSAIYLIARALRPSASPSASFSWSRWDQRRSIA